MQSINLKFTLLAVSLFLVLQVRGQSNVSLGDPVLNEDFGFGGPYQPSGPPLADGLTDLTYGGVCPDGGQYHIITYSSGGCFNATWYTINSDHSNTNPYGYMMLVNASKKANVVYTQKIPGKILCPNAQYEFSIWVYNLLVTNAFTIAANDVQPDLLFSVQKADGTVLQTPYDTGIIPPDQGWTQYHMLFTSPADGSDIIVKLINNSLNDQGNDFALDDVSVKPVGPKINAGFATAADSVTRNICEHDNATYHFVSQLVGYASPQYQWQTNTNAKGWVNITGANSSTYDPPPVVNAELGTYQYRVGVLSGAGASVNCRIYSAPLNVFVNPFPFFKLPAATPVCEGDPLQLFGNNGVAYFWTGPNGFTSTDQNPIINSSASPSLSGTYTATVSSNFCSVISSTQVTVYPALIPTISADQTICAGEAATLTAGGGTIYKWTPSTGLNFDNIASPVARPAKTTEYKVEIGNGACTKIQDVTITVLQLPQANAGADVKIEEGETVKLKGTVAGDSVRYYWTPAQSLDDPLSATPNASPVDQITYTLHVESLGTCGVSTDDVHVQVYKKLTIPDTFSPNNDGKNDLWNIDQLATYPESVLTIFTRGGQQVFRSIGNARAWDGIFQGQQLPATTYYYVLDLKNDTPVRAGWVLLVR